MRTLLGRLRTRLRPSSPQPIILMYHRIARPAVDPWGLAVRPEHFEDQLSVLERTRRPFSMSEFVHRLERGTLRPDAVAVTFDDGYRDNLRAAQPRLAARGIPACLFVTTGAVGQGREFWWDELARGILLGTAAVEAELLINGRPYSLSLPEDQRGGTAGTWRAWEEPTRPREAAYLELWSRLRAAAADERRRVLDELHVVLRLGGPDEDDLPMTAPELEQLCAGGLFEIGGHTVTHPALPLLDPAGRRREILEGKLACERLSGRTAAGFAYPHGAFDADSRAAVQESGFDWACSTESRVVSPRQYDRFTLPRVAVPDVDGDELERQLLAVCAS